MRPETGPMQFEEDWRGVFIRGDNSLMRYIPLLNELRKKLTPEDDFLISIGLDDLISVLSSAAHHQENEHVQMMKAFKECVKP